MEEMLRQTQLNHDPASPAELTLYWHNLIPTNLIRNTRLADLYFILLFYGCKDKSVLRNLCSHKETKSRAIFTDGTAEQFSKNETCRKQHNSCVLILGLGKDIQITDYRLQFIWGAMYASNKR